MESESVDLYALILFLVYEKKVLSFEDTKDKLSYYMQDKYKKSMNRYLNEYKNRFLINYNPSVYEVSTKNHHTYQVVYIVAINEKQATSYAFSKFIIPSEISLCDLDRLMTKFNNKNEPINLTIRQLRDQAKEVPSILGGY